MLKNWKNFFLLQVPLVMICLKNFGSIGQRLNRAGLMFLRFIFITMMANALSCIYLIIPNFQERKLIAKKMQLAERATN